MMELPIWAYLLYGIAKLLNWIDWTLLAIFGRRLQKIDLQKFINSLSTKEQDELLDPDILEPLSLQIQGLQKDTCLNASIRFMYMNQLRECLQRRVDHKEAIIKNPEILRTPIRRPVFLIGIPRSGTSFLLNTLSLDPGFRTPMLWELMNPLPARGPTDNWRNDSRYLDACRIIDFKLKFLNDANFDSIHYVRAHLPYECWISLRHSFYTNIILQTLPSMKEFNQWHFSRDLGFQRRMYTFYKQQLQVLGHGHSMEKRHFLCKCYLHSLNLEALLDKFPDACLVFTYRKLSKVIPSFISLMSTFSYGSVDADFGARTLEFMSNIVNNAAGNLQKLLKRDASRTNLLFLQYEDLMKDRIGSVMKIYDHFGLETQGNLKEMFEAHLKNNPQHKHGKHKYSLADYGITLDDIESSCKQYVSFMKQFTDDVL